MDTTTEMTIEERDAQYRILSKYRDEKIIPPVQQMARLTGVGITTIATFMSGNSTNKKVREKIEEICKKNFPKKLPEDLAKLFAIWARDRT